MAANNKNIRKTFYICIALVFMTASLRAKAITTDNLKKAYDVIVVGGDAEGIAAGIGAARTGAQTLLIDTRPVPGGLLTRGWLNTIDLNLDRNNKPLNGGFFAEIYQNLGDHSFDVTIMEAILTRLIEKEQNLDYLKNALTVLPVVGSTTMRLYRPGQTLCPDGSNLPKHLTTDTSPELAASGSRLLIDGVEIHTDLGKARRVLAKCLIDATQDADLAVAAGASWSAYGEDVWGRPLNMAATLVFRLGGITTKDWQKMCNDLSYQKGDNFKPGGKRDSIWGFGETMKNFSAATDTIRLRGLNLGRQQDGTVLANALLIFGVDGLNAQSRRDARNLAESQLPALTSFLRKSIPAMQQATIIGTAPELYIRTSRQIKSQYTLTVNDVLENRSFTDRIGFGSYPLDIQAQTSDSFGDVTGKPQQYAVPLRSLLPIGFGNLLVVGRSAGFDSLAQSSARTIPVGIAAGQGAGVAAALSISKDWALATIPGNNEAISAIHLQLQQQGVKITDEVIEPAALTKHWAYEGLKFMRQRGQISGGYNNSYRLDKAISGKSFFNRLANLCPALHDKKSQSVHDYLAMAEKVSMANACQILDYLDQLKFVEQAVMPDVITIAPQDAFNRLRQKGLFKQPFASAMLRLEEPLSQGAAYVLLQRWFASR